MILILAYGNTLRRDDGAGLALGEELFRVWSAGGFFCRLIQAHQLLPEHAEEIAQPGVEALVFCDSQAVSGAGEPAIRFERLSAEKGISAAGHFFSPQALLASALTLFHSAPPAWIATVPGSDYQHGEGLSQSTKNLLWGSGGGFPATLLEDILTVLHHKQNPNPPADA